MKFRDYRGNLVEAPKDLPQTITNLYDGLIVWSRDKEKHQIRYGLQIKTFPGPIMAAEFLGHCVMHNASCDGLLTYPPA